MRRRGWFCRPFLRSPTGSRWQEEGVEVAHSIEEALKIANAPHVAVIGGAEIYTLFLPHADRIELTEVLDDIEGDTSWPDPRHSGSWREVASEMHEAQDGRPPYRFVTLERA